MQSTDFNLLHRSIFIIIEDSLEYSSQNNSFDSLFNPNKAL